MVILCGPIPISMTMLYWYIHLSFMLLYCLPIYGDAVHVDLSMNLWWCCVYLSMVIICLPINISNPLCSCFDLSMYPGDIVLTYPCIPGDIVFTYPCIPGDIVLTIVCRHLQNFLRHLTFMVWSTQGCRDRTKNDKLICKKFSGRRRFGATTFYRLFLYLQRGHKT